MTEEVKRTKAETEYANAFLAVKKALGGKPDLWRRVAGALASRGRHTHSVYVAGLLAFELEASEVTDVTLLSSVSLLVAAHAFDIGGDRLSDCLLEIAGHPRNSPAFLIGRLGLAYFGMAAEQVVGEENKEGWRWRSESSDL